MAVVGFRARAAGAYLLIGLPDGMLGVAWPWIRRDMHLPLDALGLLLVGSTVGYLGTSSTSGRTLRRFGALIVLAGATTVQVLGTTGFAVASSLLLLVAGAVGLGLGAGAIDATITSTVSLGARPSELNALQGVYCVGAALALGHSSSPFSPPAGGLHMLCWHLPKGRWRCAGWPTFAERPERDFIARAEPGSLRRGVLALTMAAFFLAGGLEFATASWAASYLEARTTSSVVLVGLGVGVFWSTLAGSRFAAAATPYGWAPVLLAMIGAMAAALGGLLLWAFPGGAAGRGFRNAWPRDRPHLPSLGPHDPSPVGPFCRALGDGMAVGRRERWSGCLSSCRRRRPAARRVYSHRPVTSGLSRHDCQRDVRPPTISTAAYGPGEAGGMNPVVAVDWGGTWARAALVERGALLSEIYREQPAGRWVSNSQLSRTWSGD